jgi:hypothetical protein
MNGEKSSETSKNVKKRHWCFVLYPESAPHDWVERLEKTGLPVAISPLHDSDKDPTEEEKKPHYHIILMYSGPTTFNSVKSLTDSLKQPIPQPLESVRGYYRYFTHLDNPDKYQYEASDIRHIGGFNISDFIELTKSEVNTLKRNLQQFIRDYQVTEYSSFMDLLLDNEMMAEWEIASNHTYFFNAYLKSRRHLQETKTMQERDQRQERERQERDLKEVKAMQEREQRGDGDGEV